MARRKVDDGIAIDRADGEKVIKTVPAPDISATRRKRKVQDLPAYSDTELAAIRTHQARTAQAISAVESVVPELFSVLNVLVSAFTLTESAVLVDDDKVRLAQQIIQDRLLPKIQQYPEIFTLANITPDDATGGNDVN